MVRKPMGVCGEKEEDLSEYMAYLSDGIHQDQGRPQNLMTCLYTSFILLMPDYGGCLSDFLDHKMSSDDFRDEQHYLTTILGSPEVHPGYIVFLI